MNGEYEKKYGRLVAKAWMDDEFREQLLRDPASTLRDNGIEVPEGVEVRIVELPPLHDSPMTSPERFILALPARPLAAEISDEEIARVAGGDAHLPSPGCRCWCHSCLA